MPQEVFTDFDGMNELVSQFLARDSAENAVPQFGPEGNVTGFFDRREGAPEGQPQTGRVLAHLEYLKQVRPDFQPQLGQKLPDFQVADPFESEGLFDSIGNVFQAGFNQSITGLAKQAITGTPVFDVEGFQPNWVEKIGIEVASFIDPFIGIPALGVGAKIGGVLVRGAMGKSLVSILGRQGVKSAVAKKSAQKILNKTTATTLNAAEKAAAATLKQQMARLAPRVASSVASTSASLGTFEAVRTPIAEVAAGKEFELATFLGDALSGLAHGAGIGAAVGAASGAIPGAIAGSTLLSSTAKFGAEVGVFGSSAPFLEGRAPTFDDYLDAAAFIGVLKGVGAGVKRFTGAKAKEMKDTADEMVESGKAKTESEAVDIQMSNVIAEKLGQSADGVPIGKLVADIANGKKKVSTKGKFRAVEPEGAPKPEVDPLTALRQSLTVLGRYPKGEIKPKPKGTPAQKVVKPTVKASEVTEINYKEKLPAFFKKAAELKVNLGVGSAEKSLSDAKIAVSIAKERALSDSAKNIHELYSVTEGLQSSEPTFVRSSTRFGTSGGYDARKNSIHLTTDATEFNTKSLTPSKVVMHEVGHWAMLNRATPEFMKVIHAKFKQLKGDISFIEEYHGGKAGKAFPKTKFNDMGEVVAEAYAIHKHGGKIPSELLPVVKRLDSMVPDALRKKATIFAEKARVDINKKGGVRGGEEIPQVVPTKVSVTPKQKIGIKKLAKDKTAKKGLSQEVFGEQKIEGVEIKPFTISRGAKAGKKTITVDNLRNVADLEKLQKFVAENKEFTNINFSEKFQKTELFKNLQERGFVSDKAVKGKFRAVEPEGGTPERPLSESVTLLDSRPERSKPHERGGIAAAAKGNKTAADIAAGKFKETFDRFRGWTRQLTIGFVRTKNRLTHRGSEEAKRGMKTAEWLRHKLSSIATEEYIRLGGLEIKGRKGGEEITRLLETGDKSVAGLQNMQNILRQRLLKAARKWDPKVKEEDIIGFVENYSHRQLTRGKGEKLQGAMGAVAELIVDPETGKKIPFEEASISQLDAAVASKTLQRRGFKVGDEGIINVAMRHLLKTQPKRFKTTRDVLIELNREGGSQMLGRSAAEMHRRANLPKEWYERDARVTIPQYINQLTRSISEMEVFGINGKRALELITEVSEARPDEAVLLRKVMSMWTGAYYKERPLNPFMRKAIEAFTGFQVGMKIGLGRGTVLNVTQPWISFAPLLGVWNSIRGGLDLFNPNHRKFLRKSGVVDSMDSRAIEAFTGDPPGGVFGKFAQATTKWSGFQSINKLNLYWAGSTYLRAVKQWIPQARGTGRKAELRRKQLKSFGIDYRKDFTDKQLEQGMFEFATNSQLLKNILEEPLFINEQAVKPFFLFKRFGVRQAFWIKDMMITEVKRGNYAPIVRLALGGWAGGGAVVWALNNIKEHLSGEPQYRKDDDLWDQLTTNIAMTGALGVVSDMIEMDKASDLSRRLKFAAYPVVVSDVERVLDTYTGFMKDWERYGDGWLATKRNTYKVFSFAGSYPNYASKRLKTESQKQRTETFRKREEKKSIFDLILNAKEEAAKTRAADWNKNFPNNAFNVNEFELINLIKHLRQGMKNHIAAQAVVGTPRHRELTKIETKKLNERIKKLKETVNRERL